MEGAERQRQGPVVRLLRAVPIWKLPESSRIAWGSKILNGRSASPSFFSVSRVFARIASCAPVAIAAITSRADRSMLNLPAKVLRSVKASASPAQPSRSSTSK